MTEDRLITIDRAAALLRCSKPHIRKLHKEGKLKLVTLGNRRVRVSEQSLAALMQVSTPNHRRLYALDAADYLGLTIDQLYRLRASGNGPPFVKLPGSQRILYDTRDLDAWLDANKRQTISKA